MIVLIRHFLAITALPFVVAVLVPIWVARRNGVAFTLGATAPQLLAQAKHWCSARDRTSRGRSPFSW